MKIPEDRVTGCKQQLLKIALAPSASHPAHGAPYARRSTLKARSSQRGRGTPSRLPEHRAAHLVAISGARGKRYLKRQHLFETGEAAVRFLTELVHRHPHGAWARDVEELHEMLQQVGPEAMHRAFRAALDVGGQISTAFVAECLGRPPTSPGLFPVEVR